jgi:hypothetical protein
MKKNFKCCYGISSKTDAGNILMFDYDQKDLYNFRQYLLYIQKSYNLSNIYIMSSKHGYNAICLDVMPLYIIYNIGIDILSPCDKNFFKYGYRRGYFTLRFDIDKKLIEILKSENRLYEMSIGHKLFLEWFFSIKIENCNKFNYSSKITIIQYPSNKNGYHSIDKELPDYLEVLKK